MDNSAIAAQVSAYAADECPGGAFWAALDTWEAALRGGQHDDGLEDQFFTDLRRLHELYQTHLATTLSQRNAGHIIGVTATTIGAWLKGNSFPQQRDSFTKLIALLQAAFAKAGIEVQQTEQHLLDPIGWGRRHDEVAQLRAKGVSAGVERAQAVASLADAEARARYTALPDKPRPVARWSAPQLGVHAAIPGAATTDASGGFVLPDYIERDHDRLLRTRLEGAAAGEETVMVVIRGESCTGKTRTAFEAVRACLRDWQLVFPKDTDSLLALLAAGALTPRTVLWLNEAQDFLKGPAGEAAAAALRRRLEEPGPVVVLATLWPTYHSALTAPPGRDQDDAHPNARALLAPLTPMNVPRSFAEEDMQDLRAGHDPSLATAARTSRGGAITQTLAAGPQLVDHYEHAVPPHGPYGKAVITAAMDARRLGHTSPLPAALLQEAAPGYLTEEQRAAAEPETWFADALAYARTRVKDVVAALGPVAHPAGMGAIAGVYRLADYLDHHARTARFYDCPPAAFWSAAQQHAATPADLHALADAAKDRGRYQAADGLYRKAADGGATSALMSFAEMRARSGDLDGAERLAREAAAAGDSSVLESLGWMRQETGDLDGAEQLFRQAADTGHTSALVSLAKMRQQTGDLNGAEQLFRQGANAGDTFAMASLAWLRQEAGDREGAEQLAREVADAGDSFALTSLAKIRREAGDLDGAEPLLRQAADAGDPFALTSLARMRERSGDRDAAEQLFRQAADIGYTPALASLAEMLEEAGDREGAERLARELADAGDTLALMSLAEMREQAGDREGAEQLAGELAAVGDTSALMSVAGLRERSGDLDGAERLYRRAADAADPFALAFLAGMWEETGDLDGAERLYRRAADAGDTSALTSLMAMWKKAGKQTEADQLRRFGFEPDGSLAGDSMP